jgi:hypothetical protein
MLVLLQLVTDAAVPLKVTVPGLDPKLLPVMLTAVPTDPAVGDTPVIEGGTVTVKVTPLLASPFAVTTTLPVVAPLGTVTPMLVSLQPVADAIVPLNVTVPWLDPKLLPVIVTVALT